MKCQYADKCKLFEDDCTQEYFDKANGHCFVAKGGK